MKKLILFFALAFLSINAQTMLPHMEKQTPEFKEYLIEHTIFTIWETVSNHTGSFEGEGTKINENFFEFDGNGNLLKAVYKASQAQIVSVDSFVYDQKFILRSVISYDHVNEFAEQPGIKTIRELSYDKAGRLSKIKIHTLSGNKKEDMGSYEYEYNPDGTIKKVSDKTKNNIYGEAMPQTDYFYDNGKLIKEESAVRIAEHEYDSYGMIVKTVESLEGGDGSTTEYFYDEEGKLERKTFKGLMTSGTSVYIYDFEGKLKAVQDSFILSQGAEPSLTLTEYYYNFQME